MSLELYQRGVTSYLKGNNKALQKIMASPLLSLDGRRLLKARHHMRLQDFATALDLLNRAPCPSGTAYEGDRHFLLGNCHSFRGQWKLALEHSICALEHYTKCGHRRGQFLCNYNLSVDFQHLGDTASEIRHLQIAKSLIDSTEEKALVARAESFLLARDAQFESALSILESTLAVADINPIDRVQIQILRVEILALSGDLNQALKLSRTLINRKATFERARIVFENHALRLLMRDTTAFSSEQPAVLATSNEYQLKWELVRALQAGDLDRAKEIWRNLARELPGHLEKEFLSVSEYESKAIFGRCLENLKSGSPPVPVMSTEGLEKHLIDILSTARVPLRKEILIEFLWNVKYCSSLDNRFYQLVRRLRRKGVNIQNVRFAYRI